MTFTTPAIVLRTIDYGEADRVVTLLGRTTGRVAALARSARRSQKRFGGGLGMCAAGRATLRERPGADLATLERFDIEAPHPSLGSDVAKMAHAAYAAELASRLCAPRQAETDAYDWLEEFLRRLDAGAATAERLRVFELGLLARLGFAPAIDVCLACGRDALDDEETRWDVGRGGTVCRSCGAFGRPMRVPVRQALGRMAAMSLADAETLRLPPDVNSACRDAILEVVQSHVAGPLKSVEFIAKIGAGPGGAR